MALERVADGVWLLRGDIRGAMNVYFIEDGDGVVQFDAGTKSMRGRVATAAQELGGLKRIVLGHAHADHRGTAPYLGAPVFCHADEVNDAESTKAVTPYFNLSLLEVAPIRWIYPMLLKHWDGGPVKVAGTVAEGDEVAGFRVLHFPGHAPGLIGLWRGRGERPPPGFRLEPPGGEAVFAAAGGARTAGRRRRPRATAARRGPAGDARGGGGEVLSGGGPQEAEAARAAHPRS